MNNYSEISYELLLSKRGLPYETERERQARLIEASRPWDPDGLGWRMAARLGDLFAGLRWQQEPRVASEPCAVPC